MTRPLLRLCVSLIVGSLLAIGCAAESEDDPDALGNDDDGEVSESTSEALGGCYQCSNCVKYARCRQPRLPTGLTSWSQKVARINSRTARAGCVAVIKTSSSYGHVAYVNRVSGDTIHIDEGNWPNGHCGTRSGTQASLRISGYICP